MALTKVSGDILKQPLNVGIITATSINVSGITTLGITSATSLVVSGISTLGITTATNLTSQSLVVSGISTLGITSATNLTSQSLVVSGISTLGITSATNLTSQSLVVSGISTLGITSTTNLTSQSLVVSGISTFTNGPILVGTATSTGTASQRLQVDGGAYVSGSVGIGTTNPTYKVHVAGDIKSTQALHFGTGGTYEAGTIYSDANWGAIIRANTTSPVIADFMITNSADVYRFKIDTSGNVIIPGNATATGTASQPLQVDGGAYVSGNLGVGVTNPSAKLQVIGDVLSSYNILTSSLQITSSTDASSYISVDGNVDRLSYNGTSIGLASIPGYSCSANLYIGGGFSIIPAGWSGTISGIADANASSLGTSVYLQTSTDGSTWTTRDNTSGSTGKTLIYSVSPSTTPLYVRFTLNQGSGGSVGEGACRISNISITNLQSLPNKPSISSRFLVSGAGNVGIGTDNPGAKLDIGAAACKSATDTAATVTGYFGSNATIADTFTVDTNKVLHHYGLTWKTFSDTTNAPSASLSGYNGVRFYTLGTERFRIDSTGNVGINTINPQYKLHVVGSFAATTKSFVITHPTKQNYKLQHGSLEGPENGVYIRGRTTENIIELPEYWTELVDKNSITVNLTPIGNKHIWIEEINNNKVYIDSNSDIDCFYTVFAERKDVEKLIVEIEEN